MRVSLSVDLGRWHTLDFSGTQHAEDSHGGLLY